MRAMLQTVARLLPQQSLVLVTVTAATGAAPRGTGARMLVGAHGRICGTVGGGAVEYRCEQLALEALTEKRSRQQDFSLTRDDVQNLGMICGGAVEVFFHVIPRADPNTLALTRKAEALFSAGKAMWLLSDLDRGGALSLYTSEEGFWGEAAPKQLHAPLPRSPKVLEWEGRRFCAEQINSPGRVYIFGCGHVARELEPLLTHVGFRCVMLDDRPDFADRQFFPTAEAVHTVDFTRISDTVTVTQEDYVCIMTRGHAADTVIQAQVLPCRPCYVGVIGSRKKAAAVRQTLQTQYGLSDDLLDLVTTPIGLPIDAETPAEIAVSVTAQLIQTRRRLAE